MSLDKAKVNCERCFRVASNLIEKAAEKDIAGLLKRKLKYHINHEGPVSNEDFISKPDFRKDVCSKSDEVYEIRNYVLDTLENLRTSDKYRGRSGVAINASHGCVECDYSSFKVLSYLNTDRFKDL